MPERWAVWRDSWRASPPIGTTPTVLSAGSGLITTMPSIGCPASLAARATLARASAVAYPEETAKTLTPAVGASAGLVSSTATMDNVNDKAENS